MSAALKLVLQMESNFNKLGLAVPPAKIEELSFLVLRSYRAASRYFHTMDHVFEVAQSEDPLAFFAGVFHDIVYFQVDGGLGTEVSKIFQGKVEAKEGGAIVTLEADDKLGALCFQIFAKNNGQFISIFDGLNELLSALVAIESLKSLLKASDCLKIAAMIEATIPFRSQSSDKDWTLHLENRLDLALQEIGERPSAVELREIIRKSVELANRDVKNFADPDYLDFLGGTWELLPETNIQMRAYGAYSVVVYRTALSKMLGFLMFLKPEDVFHYYRDLIPQSFVQEKIPIVKNNLNFSICYLKLKAMTAMLFENVVLDTGSDGPISYFSGEIAVSAEERGGIEDYFPRLDYSQPSSDLEKLLYFGRVEAVSHDIKNAPIASYFYKKCGLEQCLKIFDIGSLVLSGKASRRDFYQSFTEDSFDDFVIALKKVAPTRKEALDLLLQNVKSARVK
jgi:hypothetical protein